MPRRLIGKGVGGSATDFGASPSTDSIAAATTRDIYTVNPSPLDDSVNRMLDAAERAQAQGQAEEAERLWSAARSLAPDHPFVSAALGVRALRKGDAAEARGLLEKAVQARPSDPILHLNLATALRAL